MHSSLPRPLSSLVLVRRILIVASAATLSFGLAACESDEDVTNDLVDALSDAIAADVADAGPDANEEDSGEVMTDAEGDAEADTAPEAPVLPELEAGWNVVEPGGDTICSRGTPFRFAVRPGTVNRVVVDFMGGGACWDDLTCSIAGSIFNEDVENIDALVGQSGAGIYDTENEENPFKDWYHVFIPYCTGDIHWGDSTTTYGSGNSEFEINHRGQANVRAVLDYLDAEFSGPDNVFVTGCSAGAYGSVMWAPTIFEIFPDAVHAQFGDSGAGIITQQFFSDSFPSWNPDGAFPAFIPDLDPATTEIIELNASDLYGRVAAYYPNTPITQYHSAYDNNQTFYFEAMGGGDQFAWSAEMYESMEYAESLSPNISTYIGPGETHCMIPYDRFYEAEADGVRLVDWVRELSEGTMTDSVRCTDCEPPGGGE
ncbi:MAG: hypothetical protein ACI81R_001647 [Bradymonadia bacterium]|jgi:hypothetical protein